MATTTASVSISSSDMIPGMAMNYYKTSTLHKAGGCKGLEKIQSASKEYTSTSTVELLDESVVTTDAANKLYIKNLSTDTTEYFTLFIQSEELGRLYAGDWMFIPWCAASGKDIEFTASDATETTLEYTCFYE